MTNEERIPGPAAAILLPQEPSTTQLAQAQQPDAPERKPASSLSLSGAGLKFIKDRESFYEEVAPDQAGNPTIGYGHKLLPGEQGRFQGKIDDEAASDLLAKDVAAAEKAVRAMVKGPLS